MTQQYEFRYQKVELIKTESLGIGAYGAVCKAMCDDLPCAAKILHPALFQFTAPGATSVMQKFEQECHLLSGIKHPHIVQYLGTYCDPESRLPVLLMELMDESLTHFLEQSQKPLLYHTEVNLCHDIVLALSYLHSNGIVHRDLSSNNVLLIAGSRAKVTDFGMVKLYDVNQGTIHLTPLTLCPGTVAYMPPEALEEPPMYTDKLDSFSYGVLCVQIMTRQFPDPGERFTIIEINDPRAPSGRVKVDIPEIKRRRSHIDLIDPAHPLLPVALDCLKDKGRERPCCHELCGHVSTLKASPKYIESVQHTKPTQTANREGREREMQPSQHTNDLQQQLHTLNNQLQWKEQEIQQQRQQILGLQTHLFTKEKELAGKDHELEQKETTIATCQQEIEQLRQQLRISEQVTAQFQQKENMLQDQKRQIQELQQQLKQKGQGQEEVESGSAAARGSRIELRWRDGGRAPDEMLGQLVAVDGSVAYFLTKLVINHRVFAYNSLNDKWSELPRCPNHDISLAVVNSLLTAIGGVTPNGELTNSLLSLTDMKWTEQFPPMPTKRQWTAAVYSGKSLVVAGGSRQGNKSDLSTVEVMDTHTLQWSIASSLPHPVYEASAALCGDQVYIVGGFYRDDEFSKSVFTCSLAALLQSCQPQSLIAKLWNWSLARGPTVWHKLADAPVTKSTCASLHGQLLAVGGCDSNDKETTAIHMYNTTTSSWEVISHMTTPRSECLVAVLPQDKLVVVGGDAKNTSVEIATVF